jgi:hypothetical protein
LLDLLGFDDRQTGARALMLAGLFDRLIFKYRMTPSAVEATGIPLAGLLPFDAILRFSTERLNHLIRNPKLVFGADAPMAPWLERWADLTSCGLRVQIDATNDRSRLVEPEYLVALFSSELRVLRGVSISRRNKPFYPWISRLPIYATGTLGYRTKDIPPLLDIPKTDTVVDVPPRLVIFGPSDAQVDALGSYLANQERTPAAAAIFLQRTAERHEVIGHLLAAAMEKSNLSFAATLHVDDRDAMDAWMDFLATSYRRHGNLDEVLLEGFRQLSSTPQGTGDSAPLILVGEGFLDRDPIDPRKHIKMLLNEQFEHYDAYDRFGANNAAPMASELGQLQHIPAVREALKKRWVQLAVRREGDDTPSDVLYPATAYTVELFIDAVITTSYVSTLPLSSAGLSFRDGPEELAIVFVPLYGEADARHTTGQTQKLDLPAEGRSTSATFALRTPDAMWDFRARIVVMHRSTVLQTLILGLEPIAGDPWLGLPFRLVVESDVTRDTATARAEAQKFDLTLVLNENPAGAHGATLINDDLALFTQPEGWTTFVEDTQDILAELTDVEDLPNKLDDWNLNRTLRELAWAGRNALRELTRQAPGVDFSKAEHVQVIEAVNGAFIPIEFFYDGPPPSQQAKLCKDAAQALANGTCGTACSATLSEAVICPLSFWGLTKRIERMKSSDKSKDVGIRVPKAGSVARRTLHTALLGASAKVEPPDYVDLQTRLRGSLRTVYDASDWRAWRRAVTIRQPEMLVLLPHTAPHPIYPRQLSMEIHRNHLIYAELKNEDVIAHKNHAPVVLLLGCETAATKRVPFINFASLFYASGAFLVIATLAAVRGKHVATFAAELTERLKTNASGTKGDFGKTFLALKRDMLATGNALGLAMIAYGDTTWEIDHE